MSSSRFPYNHGDMLKTKLPKKELDICPNPPDTKPVPYDNYIGSHRFGQIKSRAEVWHLMWYVWEFVGHLWYLSYDFDNFIKKIAENESVDGPGENDFTNYFSAMIDDSKSVYNQHILIHFDVMWAQCKGNQKMWNTKLAKLREAFNKYIKEMRVGLPETWQEKLTSIYGDNWGSYLWQCATFDELGSFITVHNEYFKKTEDAKEMLCHLQIPEQEFNMAGYKKQKVASIISDEEKIESLYSIKIWVRVMKNAAGELFGYPATPQAWFRGGFGIIANYSNHTSIFPNGASNWVKKCRAKEVKVKFYLMERKRYSPSSESYENDTMMVGVNGGLILCDNRDDMFYKLNHSDLTARKKSRPKNTLSSLGEGNIKGESLLDFANHKLAEDMGWFREMVQKKRDDDLVSKMKSGKE